MALDQLSPDIQEALLTLPATKGRPEIHEKRLRPIATMLNWNEQLAEWKRICVEVQLSDEAKKESDNQI